MSLTVFLPFVCYVLVWGLFIYLFILLLCLVGVYCGIYKNSYSISDISHFNSPPPPFFFISPHPIPGMVTTGVISPFTYMCTQYLQYIHPPTPFYHLLPPTSTNLFPPNRTCSSLLFSDFVNKKKMTFLQFKIATQEVSLWHFHVRMYYSLNWFISSILLLSALVPFLWWLYQV
jgi:uncharacterized membrane protein